MNKNKLVESKEDNLIWIKLYSEQKRITCLIGVLILLLQKTLMFIKFFDKRCDIHLWHCNVYIKFYVNVLYRQKFTNNLYQSDWSKNFFFELLRFINLMNVL